jgi:predicted regulator of Ras-like GTPase activity (Roadblock/LC7/MglB family)
MRKPFGAFPVWLAPIAALAMAAPTVGGAAESARPSAPWLVSPAAEGVDARVDTHCPTFSWTESTGAQRYEIVVYEVTDPRAAGHEPASEPVVRRSVRAGASSWTPSLGECLAAGRYGWTVGAVSPPADGQEEARWSRPALFRVEDVEPPGAGKVPLRRGHDVASAAAPAPSSRAASRVAASTAPRRLAAAAYVPPGCTLGGEEFSDVPASDPFCLWIEQLARDGIFAGCGGNDFCPDNPVTRKQLAMALEKSMRGTTTWSPAQGSNVLAPPGTNSATTVDDPGALAGDYASITVGTDGLPIISYRGGGAVGTLNVAHCNDLACAGQDEPISVVDDSGNNVGAYSSIAVGGDGMPVISYYDDTADALIVAHCNDVACSGQDETITNVDDAAGALGAFCSIAIDRNGLPIISYLDQAANALKVARCVDAACSLPATKIIVDDPANFVGFYTSIVIGADGQPIVSYYDSSSLALRVAHCDTPASAFGEWTVTTVDNPANDVGKYSSITIGADGLPVISYQDFTANDLIVAHCNDVKCAGANETITLVDGTASAVGDHTSITVGADGLPIVSYRGIGAPGTLKVAHCGDLACSGSNRSVTAVDAPANSVGFHTSITIGADGLPVIAYFDDTADALKVAHCANAFCTPYFRRR